MLPLWRFRRVRVLEAGDVVELYLGTAYRHYTAVRGKKEEISEHERGDVVELYLGTAYRHYTAVRGKKKTGKEMSEY